MPVAPSPTTFYSSGSRAGYYSSRSTPSTSLLLNRTPSLDRSSYSSYSPSTYGSSSYSSYLSSSYNTSSVSPYVSKYSASRPPRPSYSSSVSSDSFRSRNIRGTSPVRSSYGTRNSLDYRNSEVRNSEVRQGSETRTPETRSNYDAPSRYSSSTASSRLRDNSNSRDSGYGSSRISSRERSWDYTNGNTPTSISKAFGPSTTSYASNYRWEGRNKSKEKDTEKEDDESSEKGKVRVSDRIRNFEVSDDDVPSSSRRSSRDDDVTARRQRDNDSINARRKRLGLSPTRDSRSRTPDYHTITSSTSHKHDYLKQLSPERNGNDDSDDALEPRQSVSELRRKYDPSNLNGYATSTSKEDDDSNDDTTSYRPSTTSSYRDTQTTYGESPTSISFANRRRTDSDNYSRDSISSNNAKDLTDSFSSTKDYITKDSPKDITDVTSRLESPLLTRKRVDSLVVSRSPDGRKSPLTNGTTDKSLQHLDDPACSVVVSCSTASAISNLYARGANRRDRVRERIAARLAREVEDDDAPPRSSSGGGGGGHFSESNGLVGLRNIGNTCFLNSVTQCLSNTRCLLEYLVKEDYASAINTSSLSTMKGDLIRAFGNLISEMWTEGDSNRALNTGPFKTQIQRFAPTFTGYQQHDAQEFLRKLLEGLHEDVNRVTIRPRPILTDIDDELNDDQKAMESWKRYLRFDDSKIVDMFVGQLKSSLQCSSCSHTSVTFDPFWDLSLPIPNKSGTVRLNQCLDLFTKEEILDGDERPTCSKCKERRKMSKSFSIQKFPRVLVLHLKRFSPTERWRGKLTCNVEFPSEGLSLAKYASNPRSSSCYNLIGVANHSGTTYSGHYTAFCKHPYSNQWHEYNDSRVSSIPVRRVCSAEAYLLFYELTPSSTKL